MAQEHPLPAHTLTFEGTLNVFSIKDQWEQAKVLLDLQSGEAEVDLRLVSDLDEIGIQLLCTLDQILRARGLTFRVVGVQEAWKPSFASMRASHLHGEGEPGSECVL